MQKIHMKFGKCKDCNNRTSVVVLHNFSTRQDENQCSLCYYKERTFQQEMLQEVIKQHKQQINKAEKKLQFLNQDFEIVRENFVDFNSPKV